MELQGEDGPKIELRNDAETVLGRRLGFNTNDRTVSRRHVVLHYQPPLRSSNAQTEPTVSFQVIGKNPIWLRGGEDIKVFRRSETGSAASGDCFCISSRAPTWFKLKRTEAGEEKMDLKTAGGIESDPGLETFDISAIDPVKEFGFLVIGKEFDCYPRHRIREAKNWNWFVEEAGENSEEEGSCDGKRRRKRKTDNEEEDEDWTGEIKDDKEIVSKAGVASRPKYLTRSKDKKSKTGIDTKRRKGGSERRKTDVLDEEEDDETLGGFIVTDEEEELNGSDDEEEEVEEEFIDDEDDE